MGAEVRRVLDEHGFEAAELILSYWNMTGIPNAQFEDADAAAFQAAAAVYMQDSVIDRAILFRADTGTDLHYKITDPAGIFGSDGRGNAKTGSFRLVGQTLTARERLGVSGGDENGFAVLAGRTEAGDVVRILITNYAIPEAYLEARDRDVLEFKVPVGSIKSGHVAVSSPETDSRQKRRRGRLFARSRQPAVGERPLHSCAIPSRRSTRGRDRRFTYRLRQCAEHHGAIDGSRGRTHRDKPDPRIDRAGVSRMAAFRLDVTSEADLTRAVR